MYVEPITTPLPIQNLLSFEISVNGVDGMTAQSFINLVYGKINNTRKYCVHIKIVEE